MHFYVEKTIEYRLEEAKRTQRNAEFAREARALRHRARPAMRWSFRRGLARMRVPERIYSFIGTPEP